MAKRKKCFDIDFLTNSWVFVHLTCVLTLLTLCNFNKVMFRFTLKIYPFEITQPSKPDAWLDDLVFYHSICFQLNISGMMGDY